MLKASLPLGKIFNFRLRNRLRDWRTKGVVNPIKNQQQCGSCWAFSTISVIESLWAIKGNPLTSFSEQLLVDCSAGCSEIQNTSVCNSGCDGGWQWNAFQGKN
jgi:C1A family cysteine protease